jgi:hypothetical protein
MSAIRLQRMLLPAPCLDLILTLSLTMIDLGVPAGAHYVECSLMGKEGETTAPFKMLGM